MNLSHSPISEAVEPTQSDCDTLFLMSNLKPTDTGLPFVVWISVAPHDNAGHDVSVWVSRSVKVVPSEMVRVAIRPDVRVVDGDLSGSDLSVLRKMG